MWYNFTQTRTPPGKISMAGFRPTKHATEHFERYFRDVCIWRRTCRLRFIVFRSIPQLLQHFFWCRLTHFWKISAFHDAGYLLTVVRAAIFSSSSETNLRPRKSAFSLGKTQKSIGARSGLCVCVGGVYLCEVGPSHSYSKKSMTASVSSARWHGALSWWNIKFSISQFGRFFWIARVNSAESPENKQPKSWVAIMAIFVWGGACYIWKQNIINTLYWYYLR